MSDEPFAPNTASVETAAAGGVALPPLATRDSLEVCLLQALIESIGACVYFKDTQSRFVKANGFMAAKFGAKSPEEMVGRSDFDYFTPEHAQPAFADEQRIISSGVPLLGLEEKETYADGRVSWASTSKMPLRDSEGHIIGTFGISYDITAAKETEQKLANTQKELLEASRLAGMAEVSSGVLHNIGNALNSVLTSAGVLAELHSRSRLCNFPKAAQLLEQHLGDMPVFLSQDPKGKQLPAYLVQLAQAVAGEREQAQKELETLKKSIEHIKEVVSMQQNYAKNSALVEDVPPGELIEESLRISEASLNRHGITVACEIAPVPKVRVARHKVLQILVNFIRNAKHAMDESGRQDKTMTLRVSASAEGRRVLFSVKDNGVGIPQENLSRIFTFGFTTRKNGHGFGLHSSQSAARELGGIIRVESEGAGKGATFTLDLPSEDGG